MARLVRQRRDVQSILAEERGSCAPDPSMAATYQHPGGVEKRVCRMKRVCGPCPVWVSRFIDPR